MLDYIFFDDQNLGLFIHHLKGHDIDYAIQHDAMGNVVSVPDDLSDATGDELDRLYDQLLQAQAEVVEEGEDRLERDVAGIHITLNSGEPCTIRLNPDLVARLLAVISVDELKELATTVAHAVENPDNRPLCHD